MNLDRHDDFPAPRHSPRLFADVDAMPHARRMGEVVGSRLSQAKLKRLRMMAIIFACRNATDPVPYSTLVVTLDISERQAIRLFKLACHRKLRRQRV
jgi:hypothetical protein